MRLNMYRDDQTTPDRNTTYTQSSQGSNDHGFFDPDTDNVVGEPPPDTHLNTTINGVIDQTGITITHYSIQDHSSSSTYHSWTSQVLHPFPRLLDHQMQSLMLCSSTVSNSC